MPDLRGVDVGLPEVDAGVDAGVDHLVDRLVEAAIAPCRVRAEARDAEPHAVAEDLLERLGHRGAHARQAGRLVGIGRRVDQRQPPGVRLGRRVVVAAGLADRGDRAPEQVVRLAVPDADQRVRARHVLHREHARALDAAQAAVDRELTGGAGPPLRAFRPEARLVGLVGGARRRGERADRLDLVELTRVALARERVRGGTRVPASRIRNGRTSLIQAAGSLPKAGSTGPPLADRPRVHRRGGRREAVGAEAAVVLAIGQHGRRGDLADADAAVLRRAGRDRRERGVVERRQGRLLGGHDAEQDAIGGGGRGGVLRVPVARPHLDEVGLVALVDRVHGVVDGAVDHGQVDRGDGRRLAGRGHERVDGVGVPVGDGVRAGGRGGGQRDQRSRRQAQPEAARAELDHRAPPRWRVGRSG